ncbi:MAG: hypothetical protein WAW17_12380 [Rhodococcus sp. (in: high G+C Gram-positive bacteria)]|uniref:hypothetical protein n=1 Tax=Rhodococcus sp. TaxID=1831 RepID=UPI003BAEED41
MTANQSLILALDPMWPLIAATVGVATILGALDSEYSYIRKFGWKPYTSDRSNLLRVTAATAMTVLCAVGPIPEIIELGYLDFLPGSPTGYGILFGAGLFAAVLRGSAPVQSCWGPVSIGALRAAGGAGSPRTSNGDAR